MRINVKINKYIYIYIKREKEGEIYIYIYTYINSLVAFFGPLWAYWTALGYRAIPSDSWSDQHLAGRGGGMWQGPWPW